MHQKKQNEFIQTCSKFREQIEIFHFLEVFDACENNADYMFECQNVRIK